MICEQYKLEVWTNVYTDGSAANAVQVLPFTSLVAAQKQPVQQHEYTTATTKQRHWWWQILLLWTHNRRAPWLYFSLMRSQFYKPTTLSHRKKVCNLSATTAECAFSGYPPSAEFLEMNNVSYKEKATITKALMIPNQEKGAYHLLSRPEHVIMVKLRTKYNRWWAHMHKKLKMVPSAACPFGEEDWHTKEHIPSHWKRCN